MPITLIYPDLAAAVAGLLDAADADAAAVPASA